MISYQLIQFVTKLDPLGLEGHLIIEWGHSTIAKQQAGTFAALPGTSYKEPPKKYRFLGNCLSSEALRLQFKDMKKKNPIRLVVEPTHLKNMLVKLDYFHQIGVKI